MAQNDCFHIKTLTFLHHFYAKTDFSRHFDTKKKTEMPSKWPQND
jgi:hypothetical protein